MSLELVHASVEKGLRGGAGFSTAIATKGMPVALERALEELSAYDFDPHRAVGADRVDWAHRVLTLHGRAYSVLSRTAPCGSDWSGRPNRVAHHIVVDALERAGAGPAWMLDRLAQDRDALVCELPVVGERAGGPSLPSGSIAPRRARAWEQGGFDPGWAGVVAHTLIDHPSVPCYLVLPGTTETLPLLLDVFALIPEDRRWHATFSTRFLRASSAVRCQLRCIRADAPSVRALLAEPGIRSVVIEPGTSANDRAGAQAGREGTRLEVARRTPRVQPVLREAWIPHDGEPVPQDSRATALAAGTFEIASEPHAQAPSAGGAVDGPQNRRTNDRRSRAETTHALRADSLRSQGDGIVTLILFGIAGIALVASLILGVLIALRP